MQFTIGEQAVSQDSPEFRFIESLQNLNADIEVSADIVKEHNKIGLKMSLDDPSNVDILVDAAKQTDWEFTAAPVQDEQYDLVFWIPQR